jgi:O-antigen/teichoic acid export membrane protein
MAAVLGSLVGLLSILATFRYEMAITLPRDEENARAVLYACLLLACLSSTLAILLAWLCGEWVFARLGVPDLYRYWWLLPASLLGFSLYQSFYYWVSRNKGYSILAGTRLSQAGGGALTAIGMGLLSNGPLGLLLSALVFNSLGVRRLSRGALGSMLSKVLLVLFRRVVSALRSYGRFATFSAGAALLNSTGTLLSPLLFATVYDKETVGAISLAQRVVLLPMSLVGIAVAQVFLSECAEMIRERPSAVPAFFRSITRKMAFLALCLLFLGGCCPFFFPFVFGARWQTAGLFAAMMSVSCSAQLVVSPISTIAVLTDRQDLQFALDALRTVFVLVSIWLPAHIGGSAIQAVACYAFAMTVTYGISYIAYRSLAVRCATTCPKSGNTQDRPR